MSFSDERDYTEEQWQRDEAEREGLAELAAEHDHEHCVSADEPGGVLPGCPDFDDVPPNAGSAS